MKQIFQNGTSFLFRRQNSILSAAFILMVTYAVSHLVGLLKTRLLITYFFASGSADLDVYYAAFLVPDTIFQLLVIGSLSAAFIPVFTRYLSRKDADSAWHIASSSLTIVTLILACLSIVLFVLAPFLARFIAPGFSPDQVDKMVNLMRIMLTAQVFFAVSSFLTGILQSHHRFIMPAIAPIIYNLGIILGIVFLSPSLGILGPTLGVVIGAAGHLLVQIPAVRHVGFRYRFSLDHRHPGVREVVKLMPARVLALGVDQIELYIAASLASGLASGSYSLLNVARSLYSIPTSLFGVTLGQAALPALSQKSSEDKQGFMKLVNETLLQIAFFALPLSVLFVVLRIPIVRLVFGAPSFPWAATTLTGKTLAVLTVSAAFAAGLQLVVRGFYALHNTKTPLTVGFFAAALNGLVSFSLVNYFNFGLVGLAAAISVTNVFESLILYLLLYRQLGFHWSETRQYFLSLLKMILVSFVTGICIWVPMQLLDRFVFDTTRTIPLLFLTGTASVSGLLVYILLSHLFKVEQLWIVAAFLRKLSSWRSNLTSPVSDPSLTTRQE